MIYVLSAHYRTPRWLDLQLRCLEKFVGEPFQLVGSIEGVPDREIPRRRACTTVIAQRGDHAHKLNGLAEHAMAQASGDDLLVFLDGDAFPVARLGMVLDRARRGRLVAVRRDENDGDPQPHPCFSVVAVREWRAIAGRWGSGTAVGGQHRCRRDRRRRAAVGDAA